MTEQVSKLILFPLTAEVNDRGHLLVGGSDTVELAAKFGTPLYLFDEISLRRKCAEFKTEFVQRYADTSILYACKAFINKALLLLIMEEGLGLDVVSGGEIGIARTVNFPADKISFAGNNKSAEELALALDYGVGRIIVDNFHELKMLAKIAEERGRRTDILLRISPGIDPHTHKYITTGNIDSKFGFPMANAQEAVTEAMSMPGLNLMGLHFHIGSQIAETEPYHQAMEYILKFAIEMKQQHGFELKELSVGGGFAIQYTLGSPPPPLSVYAESIVSNMAGQCRKLGLALPKLVIEPGRSLVGRAGVALYKVGAIKEIPGVRCYVSVDGGMADNIRPALYGAVLEAVVANKMREKEAGKVTIAGKFCESGDILIKDITLPQLSADDIIAVPGSGAYCIPEAMNYNASFKPAVVMVRDGKARLIRRRETLEDLTRCDVV
ncbi:MAG: diaminopimelate decarboxylase [Dehalococcoidales bacterium]|nr:diaminopimelate decarboxylase [Dehalococcoidales bacterium]